MNRIKNIEYEDDDYYDEGEEEFDESQLTPEDVQKMVPAAKNVLDRLGPVDPKPPRLEVWGLLWEYWYDEEKTLSVLRKTYKVKKPQAAKSAQTTTQDKLAQRKDRKIKVPSADEVENGVAKVSINAASPRVKSKNIDVVAEYKKSNAKKAANFVVIGHVDAGKSTLMGSLLRALGAIDAHQLERYQKEADSIGKGSFALAWVMDQGSEERARGVTIDIAQNTFSTSTTNFTILDAPGHRDFVPNMIAGASQADFAVLVIDASGSNFESGLRGQTKEHALLVRSIGVSQLVVAVNKMDMAKWSQTRYEEIKTQMTAFLTSAGFSSKKITFIPCSGLSGGNILKPITESSAEWYQGPTLVFALESVQTVHTFAVDKPLRMAITDVFRGSIINPLSISGRIESGHVQLGDSILVQPKGEIHLIKAIDTDGTDNNNDKDSPSSGDVEEDDSITTATTTQWAVAGNNVTLHLLPTHSPNNPAVLSDPTQSDTRAGDVVCNPTDHPIANIHKFIAKLVTFEHLTPMLVDIHRGRLHKSGRIVKMIQTLDKATGEVLKNKPRVVQPQSWVRCEVEFVSADGSGTKEMGYRGLEVPLEKGDRVVLRAGGQTVAAGIVESM